MAKDAAKKARKADFKGAVIAAEAMGNTTTKTGEGYVQHIYSDYDTYKRIQEDANKKKINAQYVKKSHIFFLADWLSEQGVAVDFALCHGVRRGKEQAWFNRRLHGAKVIGTDISETATQFPDTVQWDFHEENPAWANRAAFVYSNSWDHAYDPAKAMVAWANCLVPGGRLFLDHTPGHLPAATNAMDPFGATEAALVKLLNDSCADFGAVETVLDRSAADEYPCRVVVFKRNIAPLKTLVQPKPKPIAKKAIAKSPAKLAAKSTAKGKTTLLSPK